MNFSRSLAVAAYFCGMALCAVAGIIAWLILLALGWGLWWRVGVALVISWHYWVDGRQRWGALPARHSNSAFHKSAVQKFFRRRIIFFCLDLAGAVLGYLIAALSLPMVSAPEWLSSMGQSLNANILCGVLDTRPPDHPGWIGVARYGGALAGVMIGETFRQLLMDRNDHNGVFRRGRRLATRAQAQFLAALHTPPGQATFSLGGVQMPDEAAKTNICIVGAIGSGKSHTLSLILQYACATIGCGNDHRAIVFDPKRDMIPRLHGMNVRARIYNLNPFDQRSVAWWISKDCKSVATAMQLAATLISEDEGANRFFSDAARELVTGDMLGLMKRAPDRWTLRDLLLTLRNQELLSQVLASDPDTRDLCQYFDEPRTYQNIRSSMASKINRFAPIAACWDRANESLALSDWILSESIIVLGYDPSIQLAMEVVNRAVYQRLSELLLAQNESTTRRVWHFADEAKTLGRLALPQVATFGRGAGNRVIIGFQDIEGMRHVYGRELAHELTGQCATKAILRLDSPETASWASQIIADCETVERHRSGVRPGDPKSGSINEQLTKREAVLAGELLDMPATNRQNGLTGYYVSPFTGVFRSTLTAQEVDQAIKPDPVIPGFIPRPPEHQFLRPFDAADYKRLGLRPPSAEPNRFPGDRS